VTGVAESQRDVLAQRLRALLTCHHNVREVRMFGGLSFMVDERMAVVAGRAGDLLVRTDPAEYDDLLQRGGIPAHMGNHRPMGRGWLTAAGVGWAVECVCHAGRTASRQTHGWRKRLAEGAKDSGFRKIWQGDKFMEWIDEGLEQRKKAWIILLPCRGKLTASLTSFGPRLR